MKFLLAIAAALLVGCSTLNIEKKDPARNLSTNVVMIYSEEGGGTGVVLQSTDKGSLILTNRHICEGIQGGGTILDYRNEESRADYAKISKIYDLCLVFTAKNLHINTPIAASAPNMFDTAIVVGHPFLMPITISKGHFSSYQTISLVMGAEKCNGQEQNEDDIFYCQAYGMKPIIESFLSQASSALTAPGNSGSPVFNTRGQISALVFAGVGEGISPSYLVPHGYIVNFIEKEVKSMKWSRLNKVLGKSEGRSYLKRPIVIQKTK